MVITKYVNLNSTFLRNGASADCIKLSERLDYRNRNIQPKQSLFEMHPPMAR